MESIAANGTAAGGVFFFLSVQQRCGDGGGGGGQGGCFQFQMPVHYPRYSREDYEAMPKWKLDCLLDQYGLPVAGDLDYKRSFAIGAFLWP